MSKKVSADHIKEEEEKDLVVENEKIESAPVTPIKEDAKVNSILSFLIQFGVVAVLFFGIGFVLGQKRYEIQTTGLVPKINVQGQTNAVQNVDFTLFWKVFETLPQTYVDKTAVDGQKMMYGAIAGMVRSLGDPYTSFFDPGQNESAKGDISGSYEGVGIQLGFDKEKRLVVIAPLKGTPAEREGVRAKDLILKIGEKDAFDITLPEAVDLIRGDAGTSVVLKFFRDGQGEPFEKTLRREKIEVQTVSVKYEVVDGGEIAIIEVTRFGEKTDAQWDKVVSEVVTKKVKGVVVDMRNNPGGLLASSVHLAEEFVNGVIVRQRYSDGKEESLSATRTGKLGKTPLVVLVNEGSASAAEIFAGAIQDKNRGKLVGEITFGKGSVQDVIDFPGGSGLHVTIAKWLTPDGNSIHDVGITPDEVVGMNAEDVQNERDPQLEKALELL